MAALRVAYSLELPANPGDAVRHILSGLAVLEHGVGVADVPLAALGPELAAVPWADRPFTYPPVALLFDAGVAALSPTLAGWKLTLTGLEAVSALLLWRLTGSRWIGLAYWASPVSIWWISHEGQIEAVQNVLALAALLALGWRRWIGWALLALAIQAKAFALFLLPWFVRAEWGALRGRTGDGSPGREGGSGRGMLGAWGFLLGLVPLAFVLPFWPLSNLLGGAALEINPWFWNPFAGELAGLNPGWMVAWGQVVTWGLLAAGAFVAFARGRPWAATGPTAFVVALKSVTNAQPWYLLSLPVLWAPLARAKPGRGRGAPGSGDARLAGSDDRRLLLGLVVVLILMEPQALVSIVGGEPVGFTMGAFYDAVGPWTPFRLP